MKYLTIEEAIDLLRTGEIIAIPTETVYGLAADARSDVAVSQIFKAKGRPSDNPLIVHIGDVAQISGLVTNVGDRARLLMDHFWPGPLTIVLQSAGLVSGLVTAGLKTVGLRMPNHKVALELLRTFDMPLAAPSANRSGKPSPTCVTHVEYDMEGRIAGVLDGGICEVGLESTVIDMSIDVPVILRPGGISQKQIESVIGHVGSHVGTYTQPKSPGMKYVHYAPEANVYIVKGCQVYVEKLIIGFKEKSLKVGVLCDDSTKYLYQLADVVLGIGAKGRHLFANLREFDTQGVDIVLCELFDDIVVMNRLMKASEGRVLSELEDEN